MTFIAAARVCETTTTTGTGNVTLAGAVSGFGTFASRCANNDTFFYAIEGVDANGVPTGEWETGVGTYVSATPAVARTTVVQSSNSDAAVSFSAGTKRVFIALPGSQTIADLSAETAIDAAADFFALWDASGSTTDKVTVEDIRAAAPTVPTVVSVGAEFTGTGTPTATLPGTHATNDILVLAIQTSNENFAAPAGYTQLGPRNGIGLSATAGSTKLCIFWKRDGGSESAPTLSDSGDHTYGFMFAVRGCPTWGDPFHLLGQAWKFTASTTGTGPKGASEMDNCLITDIFAHAVDNAAAQGSSPTNADLTSVTEQFDDGTTDGTGGGLYMLSGIKVTRGPIVASTVTWANSTVDVSQRIAWLPNKAPDYPRGANTQVFIGSAADLDDIWTKAYGAVEVFTQICDGGGSSSSGNTTTTAAGGGGGGGGGYDEAFFRTDDLAATITVHAGKGGAATTALNQAGNAGVVSEFDKGGVGPLTSARRITGIAATAAASADGGNGGGGSGRGTTQVAVQTTRLDAFGANATRPSFAQGAAGGSGTTAPTGGGNADWGGGGGESGADTDAAITSANNGWSISGGGGGSGGRTNTNASIAGFGGGATAPGTQGAAGTDSTRLPYGGSGGNGGGSSTVTGGKGGFPGGGGGGGGGVAGGFGGEGGHGCVVVTTFF